jgi:hypothetical protein
MRETVRRIAPAVKLYSCNQILPFRTGLAVFRDDSSFPKDLCCACHSARTRHQRHRSCVHRIVDIVLSAPKDWMMFETL